MSFTKTALKIVGGLFLAFVLFCIVIVVIAPNTPAQNTEQSITSNISISPDGKRVVEYAVPYAYTDDKFSWMGVYAKEHRSSPKEELHLFTFSNGVQFEYHLNNAGVPQDGFTYSGNWTNTPNESIKPTSITRQQFDENLKQYLSQYPGATYTTGQFDSGVNYLLVDVLQQNTGFSTKDTAFYLKNFIDLNPNLKGFNIIVKSPTAVSGWQNMQLTTFASDNYTLVRQDTILDQNYAVSSMKSVTWTDATYTSISNAVETSDFTNHPGKIGFS